MAELTADRRNKIAQILLRDGSIRAADMANLFHVSTETIRKDIIYLEEAGIAEKNHGGAIARVNAVEQTLNERDFLNADAKAEIADKAISLIRDNATILMDAGSTTNAIAKQLLMRNGLTIFTNSVNLVNILADSDNTVYLTGGRIRRNSRAAVGSWSQQMIESVHADLAFVGSDGFRDLNGPTSMSYEEAEVKKRMVQSSQKAYVVADSSKYAKSDRFIYTTWDHISGVITAGERAAELKAFLKGKVPVL